MAKENPGDVSIGKFDILATYTYAKALLDGLDEAEAKERGMVAAVMGAKASGDTGSGHEDDYKTTRRPPRRKRRRRSPPTPSTIRSPTKWAGSSRRPSCRP